MPYVQELRAVVGSGPLILVAADLVPVLFLPRQG